MLPVLNVAFFVFHSALILFNVVGWAVPRWRKANLATLLLTLVSWTVMGLWKGKGYCICTDLHWQVRHAMGINDHADSYLVLMVRLMTGWDPPVKLVNSVASAIFLGCLAASVTLNLRDRRPDRSGTVEA